VVALHTFDVPKHLFVWLPEGAADTTKTGSFLGLGFPFLVVSAAEAESISTKSLRIPKSSKGELFGYIIDIQWNE